MANSSPSKDNPIAQADALKNEANALVSQHRYEEAIKSYSNAIALNPNVPAYFTNRALCYIRTESYGFALKDADMALEVDPKFVKAYYRRAIANMAMLNFKAALADFNAVVKVNPSDPDARIRLDECQKIVRRLKFEKAIASSHDQRSAIESLGDIDSIEVEASYSGPRLDQDASVTPEIVVSLMDHYRGQKNLHKKFAYQILVQAKQYFQSLDSLVHVQVPKNGRITVCGDTHGQFYDVCHIFKLNGNPSSTNCYLFNGDMVDRGSFSVEVIFTLLAWVLACPGSVFLARGNHEAVDMNKMYGFEGEVKHKYSSLVFQVFTEIFNAMPLVHVIENRYFVVHGGLPHAENVTLEQIRKIDRFCQPDGSNIMSDLLWADPQEEVGRGPSTRGTGFRFGPDITHKFLELNNLEMVIRSHEVKTDGYEIMHDGKCVTIFSAPNYCDMVGNRGAFIVITPDFKLKYEQFSAVEHPKVESMKYSPMHNFV